MAELTEPYQLFSDPLHYYNAMIEDIENARKYIYIETFRVGKDEIGEQFKRVLTKKAKNGVEVRLLIDYWGAGPINHDYFKELIKYGGDIRFFEKIKFNTDIFTRSHKRNHRKLLLIDDDISWIGSSNLTGYNLNWRESMLRLKSPGLTFVFTKLFMQDYRIYNKYVFNKAYNTRLVRYGGFDILRDAPSIAIKRINQRFVNMIKASRKKVIIETPYFLPGYFLRKSMMEAAKRGVDIIVIMPRQSDVNLVDILRNKYLGPLHAEGIQFLFYTPNNLHAKLMLVDDKFFAVGSSNFDYRSFRYMYEIMLVGDDSSIVEQVKTHTRQTISESIPFDMHKWENRPLLQKIAEWFLLPFRHLL